MCILIRCWQVTIILLQEHRVMAGRAMLRTVFCTHFSALKAPHNLHLGAELQARRNVALNVGDMAMVDGGQLVELH